MSKLTECHYWPTPTSRNFSEVNDPNLFAEVLEIADREEYVSLEKLLSEEEGLRQRLRSLLIVKTLRKTTVEGVLSALERFGWIESSKINSKHYVLTDEGKNIALNHLKNERHFRRLLAAEMHQRYVLPGWFIARLLTLNPEGQGEIILPSPFKDWHPKQRDWNKPEWTINLTEQVNESLKQIKKILPDAFPIDNESYKIEVGIIWDKLGSVKQREVAKVKKSYKKQKKPKVATFSPRSRLALAMREAAVNLLFNNEHPILKKPDFRNSKHPIPPRAFTAWCPRLEALEFMFYTDSLSAISGRFLFPFGAFRSSANSSFEKIEGIVDPKGRSLYLYQPQWEEIKVKFVESLFQTFRRISQKCGALYVSLLDVRDEVCRQLRVSTILFDSFLEMTYRKTIREDLIQGQTLSISLESDIRPEQQSGSGLLRRPVYIDSVPHSLIAITTINSNKQGKIS